MKWLIPVLALAFLGAAQTAEPISSALLGVGLEWGWPCITAGFTYEPDRNTGLSGWISKYTPEIGGWWSLGVAGQASTPFPHLYIYGAPRLAIYLGPAWSPTAWHWGPELGIKWAYQLVRISLGLYAPIASNGTAGSSSTGPISTKWPFLTYVTFRFEMLLSEISKMIQ